MKRRRDRSVSNIIINFSIAVVSVFTGITAFFFMLVTVSLILSFADFSDRVCGILSALLPAAGTFAAGTAAGYMNRKNGIISGAAFSLPVFVLIFLISFYSAGTFTVSRLLMVLVTAVLSGVCGGVCGVNTHIHGHPGIRK